MATDLSKFLAQIKGNGFQPYVDVSQEGTVKRSTSGPMQTTRSG